ncbi:unnamed protein product, partial [Polarella glacialis]
DLALNERDFLESRSSRDASGRTPSTEEKEELRLEKKLREICALKRRQVAGEVLDKLQAEKVAKRGELFREVAELKLRRAEKELMRIFKRHSKAFQDAFWELEWQALYADDSTASSGSTQAPFGIFDETGCDGPVTVTQAATKAESRAPRWVGVPLHVQVRKAEVAAFAIEVLEGLVRLGWAAPGEAVGDLGSGKGGFGFGGTGKKVSDGVFASYGQSFGPGDIIHCEAEREEGRLRIGFAKNNEPLGVAFDAEDVWTGPLAGVVCGKGFKVQIVSAENEALGPGLPKETGLEGFIEYDQPQMAIAERDYRVGPEDSLLLWAGETLHVSSDDGEGWLFGFFLDPEDPDDGGWFPADCVRFLDEAVQAQESAFEARATASQGAVSERAQQSNCKSPLPPTQQGVATAGYPTEWEQAPLAAESATDEGPVGGLLEWLQKLSLQKYSAAATVWCTDMGAVSLQEVEESWEDFAEALALKPLERKRLAKAVQG